MGRPSRYHPDTLEPPKHWGSDAECQGHPTPDLWFADPETDLIAVMEAKSYCWRCPVRLPCLHGAQDRSEPFGVWGGLDENEREQLASLRVSMQLDVGGGGGAADAPASAA